MRHQPLARLGLVILAVVVTACGGEGRTPTSVGAVVHLTVLLNTPSAQAIQKARLMFDGRDVVTVESQGTDAIVLDGTVSDVERGPHVLKIEIMQQASTPNPYAAGGAVATQERILDLAPVQGVLATGDSLEIRFNL